eukprot:6928447-Pyramimonas_sp.AAC.1
MSELFMELGHIDWDFATVNETWRDVKKEFWLSQDGHAFMGTGLQSNSRGVAIVIHKRWVSAIRQFRPINERIAYVDVHKGRIKLRI